MKKQLIAICETAVCLAMAVVLDLLVKVVPFLTMPQGGSYSIAMLPIMIIGFRHGPKYSFLAGLCYGILNYLFDGYSFYWGSFLFDYILPFTALGITGLFQKKGNKVLYFELAMLLAGFIRYVCHGISGWIFFGSYAPAGMAPFFYSFVFYNLPYMFVSTLACMVIGANLHSTIYTYKYPDKSMVVEESLPLTSSQRLVYFSLFLSSLVFLLGIGFVVRYISMTKMTELEESLQAIYNLTLATNLDVSIATTLFGLISSFFLLAKIKETKEASLK